MEKDWIGNGKSIFTTLGASNHTEKEREINDYYATDPIAVDALLQGGAELNRKIWECSAGQGHLSERLTELGYEVRSTDLIDRGYGEGGIDFLQTTEMWDGDILTNPPYKYAKEFIEHALTIIPDGRKVFMFLKLQFWRERLEANCLRNTLRDMYMCHAAVFCAPKTECLRK